MTPTSLQRVGFRGEPKCKGQHLPNSLSLPLLHLPHSHSLPSPTSSTSKTLALSPSPTSFTLAFSSLFYLFHTLTERHRPMSSTLSLSFPSPSFQSGGLSARTGLTLTYRIPGGGKPGLEIGAIIIDDADAFSPNVGSKLRHANPPVSNHSLQFTLVGASRQFSVLLLPCFPPPFPLLSSKHTVQHYHRP